MIRADSASRAVRALALIEETPVTRPTRNLIEFAKRAGVSADDLPATEVSVVALPGDAQAMAEAIAQLLLGPPLAHIEILFQSHPRSRNQV